MLREELKCSESGKQEAGTSDSARNQKTISCLLPETSKLRLTSVAGSAVGVEDLLAGSAVAGEGRGGDEEGSSGGGKLGSVGLRGHLDGASLYTQTNSKPVRNGRKASEICARGWGCDLRVKCCTGALGNGCISAVMTGDR